jgi:hypothetical protein
MHKNDFAKANGKVRNTNGRATIVLARSAAEYHAQGFLKNSLQLDTVGF